MVELELERSKAVEVKEARRELAGEVVEGKVEDAEFVEREEGRREGGGEVVVVDNERAEVGERVEVVRERAEEGVVAEDEDAELVEGGEGVRGESAAEGVVREGEADDAALLAFDALPLAVVEVFVESEEEFAVEVSFGFEGEEGGCVVRGEGRRCLASCLKGEREEEEGEKCKRVLHWKPVE